MLSNIPEESDGLSALVIAHHTEIPEPKTKYFLDLLEEKHFVGYIGNLDYAGEYYIKKDGRKYLFENT